MSPLSVNLQRASAIMLGAICLLSFQGLVSPSFAGRSYYVSTDGSDRNSGAVDSPWKDIEDSVRKISPGDVLYLRGGDYTPGYRIYIRKQSGGTRGAPKTVKAYPGEKARVLGYGFLVEGSYVRIENLEFPDGAGISISNVEGRGCQVLSCTFGGLLGYAMIHVEGDDALVEGNVVDMKGSTAGTQGHGIYLSHGSDAVIRNNVIRGEVPGYGIHVFDQRRGHDSKSFRRRIRNAVIEGNSVTGSTKRSGIIAVAYDGASIDNLVIRNNVVYGNARHGIFVGAEASNVRIHNNTIHGNGGSPVHVETNYSGGTLRGVSVRNNILDLGTRAGEEHIRVTKSQPDITADANLYWPGPARLSGVSDPRAVVGEPKYVNPGAGDFRLEPNSAARYGGAGIQADIPSRDPAPSPR